MIFRLKDWEVTFDARFHFDEAVQHLIGGTPEPTIAIVGSPLCPFLVPVCCRNRTGTSGSLSADVDPFVQNKEESQLAKSLEQRRCWPTIVQQVSTL